MDRSLLIGAIACAILLAAMVVSFGLLAWRQARRDAREQALCQAENAGLSVIADDIGECVCCGGRHCKVQQAKVEEMRRRNAEQIEARRRAALAHVSSEFPAIIRRSYDTQELDRVRALWGEVSV